MASAWHEKYQRASGICLPLSLARLCLACASALRTACAPEERKYEGGPEMTSMKR